MVLLLPNVIRYSLLIHLSFDQFSDSLILLFLFLQSILFATLDRLLVESTTLFFLFNHKMDNLFLGFSDNIVKTFVSCTVGCIFLAFVSDLWSSFCKSKYLDLSSEFSFSLVLPSYDPRDLI